jgi:glycosyltransferase involved in cell wall biosynthesis
MRVLHVIARLNVGGTARYITQLANELPNHGIETFVATGFVQGLEVEDPSTETIEVIRIPALGRSINPIRDYLAQKQLRHIVKAVKPDLIHTHTFKAGYITRTTKVSVPVIHTFHGHLLCDPEFSGFKSKIIIRFEKFLARKTFKLITVGEIVGEELLEHGIGTKEQYLSIAPGVKPLDITVRAEALRNLGLSNNGEPIIGWIARVTGVKNPMLVLKIATMMPNAHFIIAGGGDLLERVKAAAPENVSVIGWAKAEDLFGVSDIILSTSENEGMPIALIEAQLGGKPVVATNVGSVAEVIANNVTGLITSKSAESIVSALQSLLEDRERSTAMGFLAKSRAQDLFSIERMINAHVALYKSIVK